MRRFAIRFAATVAVPGLVACRAVLGIEERPLVSAEPVADAAASDANIPVDGDAFVAPVDEPLDVPCDGVDAWNVTTKATQACAARRVFAILSEPALSLPCTDIALGAALSGRLLVACHERMTADEGLLHLRAFSPKGPAFNVQQWPSIVGSSVDDVGVAVKLVGSASALEPDVFHLAYQRVTGAAGPVVYRQMHASALSPEESVVSSVQQPTSLSIAAHPTGSVAVAYLDFAYEASASSSVRSRVRNAATTAFGLPQDIIRMPGPKSALIPAAGQSRVAFDETGKLHAVAFRALDHVQGVPVYGVQNAVFDTRPIEPLNRVGRRSGDGVGFALGRESKQAAYFVTEPNAPTPSLVLATWVNLGSAFEYPSYVTLVPASEIAPSAAGVADVFRPALSLAMDLHGLLHLALVRPTSDATCAVEYRRQVRVAGRTSWLVDVVASNVACKDTHDVNVDLAVDDAGRPHLVYSTIDPPAVMYATRFDR